MSVLREKVGGVIACENCGGTSWTFSTASPLVWWVCEGCEARYDRNGRRLPDA
jgi:hypothetical protein